MTRHALILLVVLLSAHCVLLAADSEREHLKGVSIGGVLINLEADDDAKTTAPTVEQLKTDSQFKIDPFGKLKLSSIFY